jgi:NAD(P)-dependent dehydrogenase (short-subunit alcohol dehydrogenase family)
MREGNAENRETNASQGASAAAGHSSCSQGPFGWLCRKEMSMSAWNEQVALVTGASSGIGRATALAFAGEGARVVAADLLGTEGEETVKLIQDRGGEAVFVKTDVSSPAEVANLVDRAIASYGRLDIAFNNAGVEGELATTAECSEDNWDRTLSINLKGVWLCMKHELPRMLERKRGSIVNCSSVAGLAGVARLPAYVASKHGIIGLTRAAALEYAKQGIRINAVCPGVIRTAMVDRLIRAHPEMESQLIAGEPMGRIGTPEEIAAAVVWLCSESASFVTGHALAVDGGWVAQ